MRIGKQCERWPHSEDECKYAGKDRTPCFRDFRVLHRSKIAPLLKPPLSPPPKSCSIPSHTLSPPSRRDRRRSNLFKSPKSHCMSIKLNTSTGTETTTHTHRCVGTCSSNGRTFIPKKVAVKLNGMYTNARRVSLVTSFAWFSDLLASAMVARDMSMESRSR